MLILSLIVLASVLVLAGCVAYIIVSFKMNGPALASRVGNRQFMLFHARRYPSRQRRAFAHSMAPRLRPIMVRSGR